MANGSSDFHEGTFKERLTVLGEVQSIQKNVEEIVGNEIYNSKNLGSKNIVYGKYEITEISSGETISNNVVSISGRKLPEQINGQSAKQTIEVQGNDSRLLPTVSKKDMRLRASIEGKALQDSERKFLIHVLDELEKKTGIRFDPLNQYKGLFKGKIELNSQNSPCNFCQEMISNLFYRMFGNDIEVITKYGTDYTEPEGNYN